METMFFLPQWPPEATNLSWFGGMLLCAVIFGELVHRFLHLPRITGYVLAGILLSPQVGGFWSPQMLERMQPFYSVAFGLILFELGQRTDLTWLRRNPWLLATSIAESLLSFLCAGVLLLFLNIPPLICLMTAGLAAATGPASVLGITKEAHTRGQVTERLYLLSALGSCYAFVTLGLTYAWMHYRHEASLGVSLLHPFYLIFGSMLLGAIVARCILWLLACARSAPYGQNIGAIALIIATVALVGQLKLSVVITMLVAGILSRSMDKNRHMLPLDFGLLARLALIVVFASTGALLKPNDFLYAIIPAVGLIVARSVGKFIGIFIFAHPSGLPMRKASLLSVGMLPMSGAALLWIENASKIWPELGNQLAAILLTALVIMELIGPPLLQFSLQRADETTEKKT